MQVSQRNVSDKAQPYCGWVELEPTREIQRPVWNVALRDDPLGDDSPMGLWTEVLMHLFQSIICGWPFPEDVHSKEFLASQAGRQRGLWKHSLYTKKWKCHAREFFWHPPRWPLPLCVENPRDLLHFFYLATSPLGHRFVFSKWSKCLDKFLYSKPLSPTDIYYLLVVAYLLLGFPNTSILFLHDVAYYLIIKLHNCTNMHT